MLVSSVAVNRFERLGHAILFILMNGGVALTMKNSIQTWAVKVVFLFWSFIFLYYIFIGADPDETLKVVSHNGVSMMMLVSCISYYIVVRQNEEKLYVWPAFLTLIISIWGIGRSGILSSFILFIGILLIKYNPKRILLILVSFPVFFILMSYEKFIDLSLNFSFLSGSILNILVKSEGDEPRLEIWENYFQNLDTFRLIFGANTKTDPWPDGEFLAYNYHNTFINLHSQTGFMGLVTIFILILALINFYRFDKIFFILLFVLLIRWFTDIGLYFESWDFLPFFFTFVMLSRIKGNGGFVLKS